MGLQKGKQKRALPLWSRSSWGVICSQRALATGENWGWWRPEVVIHLTQELSPPRRKLTPAGAKGWDGTGGETGAAASASTRLINGPLSFWNSQRLIHINAAFTPDPRLQLKCSYSKSCWKVDNWRHCSELGQPQLFWLLKSTFTLRLPIIWLDRHRRNLANHVTSRHTVDPVTIWLLRCKSELEGGSSCCEQPLKTQEEDIQAKHEARSGPFVALGKNI